jgi:hypothetical protein
MLKVEFYDIDKGMLTGYIDGYVTKGKQDCNCPGTYAVIITEEGDIMDCLISNVQVIEQQKQPTLTPEELQRIIEVHEWRK